MSIRIKIPVKEIKNNIVFREIGYDLMEIDNKIISFLNNNPKSGYSVDAITSKILKFDIKSRSRIQSGLYRLHKYGIIKRGKFRQGFYYYLENKKKVGEDSKVWKTTR